MTLLIIIWLQKYSKNPRWTAISFLFITAISSGLWVQEPIFLAWVLCSIPFGHLCSTDNCSISFVVTNNTKWPNTSRMKHLGQQGSDFKGFSVPSGGCKTCHQGMGLNDKWILMSSPLCKQSCWSLNLVWLNWGMTGKRACRQWNCDIYTSRSFPSFSWLYL